MKAPCRRAVGFATLIALLLPLGGLADPSKWVQPPDLTSDGVDVGHTDRTGMFPLVDDFDFGDAPDPTYPTLLANNGARHIIGGPWLGDAGNAPDAEPDGQPDPNALGDDFDGNDDEDGIFFPPLLRGVTTNLTFEVSGAPGLVEIWLDVDRDGAWHPVNELIYLATHPVGVHTFAYTLPHHAVPGSSFARARISTAGTGSPEGPALDGEVEDHNVFLYDPTPGWSNLQWPSATRTPVGVATENIYGQVWIDGVTSQPGATPGLAAQLGYGPPGSHPAGNPAWTWVDAAFNADVGNNDEFMATLTLDQPGWHDYGYRYAWYGAAWTYADLDGSPNGFDPNQAGKLFVWLDATECAKWHQPPDCEIGLDVAAYRAEALPPVWVADDFVSDGRPITAVRWWGSYVGYAGPPDLSVPLPGLRPSAFELRWYTDVPAGVQEPWSMPGTLIAAVTAPLLPHAEPPTGAGRVSEFFECTTDLSWAQPPVAPPYEHEYAYNLELETPWLEKEGHVYWLAIQAVYELPPLHPWGWKTTPLPHNWNDAAVTGPGTHWTAMAYPPPGWTAITNHPDRGQPVNLAFEMRTDVCPRRCKKWQQPPDMILGTDMPSWRHATLPPAGFPLRADDFISDGRRITDVHWWGSYPGWMKHIPGEADVNPVPPPVGVHRPLGFDLSFHHHDPALGGLPGSLIAHVFVPMDKCHEVYYGPVDQSDWWLETHYEHEYQYYVDLLDPEVYGAPWYELAGTHYWINIQAVFDDAFVPGEEGHGGWGWKTTPALQLDRSAVSHDGGLFWTHDGLPPPHPLEGAPFDLAFELTTPDIPPLHAPGYVEPAITNLTWRPGAVHGWVTSLGDCLCGYQVLQSATNLLDKPSAFGDLHTNYWPRAVNVWPAAGTNRQTYFRVQMRQ